MLKIFRLFRGFLVISVTGRNVERFINICMRRDILLWDIKRVRINVSKMKISINGFRKVREIAQKSNCSVRILEKRGFPFLFYKHRKRTGVFVGLVVFSLILLIMTSFVWKIEIEGNETVSEELLLTTLHDVGIYEGAWRYGMDLSALQNRVLLQRPELSWVGINLFGSKVVVSVSEDMVAPDVIDRNMPCNLIAAKDGMIEQVTATDGIAVVKPGDTVKAGDLLVSGINDSPRDGVRYLHAMGSVRAKTWKTYSKPVSTQKIIFEKTGQNKKYFTLIFLNFEINFFKKGSIPYKEYDTIEQIRECRITDSFYLPLAFKTTVYAELQSKCIEQSLDQARDETVLQLEKEVGDYQVRHIHWNPKSADAGVLTVTYETIEEIAVTQPIVWGGS